MYKIHLLKTQVRTLCGLDAFHSITDSSKKVTCISCSSTNEYRYQEFIANTMKTREYGNQSS